MPTLCETLRHFPNSCFSILKTVLCFPGTCSMWLVNFICLLPGLFSSSGLPCLPGTPLCLALLDTPYGSAWHLSHLMGTFASSVRIPHNTTASLVTSLPS